MLLQRPSCFVFTLIALAAPAAAQHVGSRTEPRMVPRWEVPGLDISVNGGWRKRVRAVAAARARLLAQRNFAALNAQAPSPLGPTAVTGALKVPVVMFRYNNSPAGQYSRDTSQYNATLFATVPPNAKPYTLRTFYEQLSNNLFSLQGQSFGWVALDSNEVTYTGGTNCVNPFGGTNCNGLFSGSAFTRMQTGLRQALAKIDATVDFSKFDADSDGVVDAVVFLHASMDGACQTSTNNHLWSHRSSLDQTGNVYVTNDVKPGGGAFEVVNDYILQSGLGSPSGGVCDSSAIMPIGTAAHELGHILDLPDLYAFDQGEGIGDWGLMASGGYTKEESPSRYDAWSLQQMGWTTIVPLTVNGTYSVGPEPTADSVFYVNVQGSNPNNEYFLIENRQSVYSDSAMIRILGGGGLMLWHVDGTKACMLSVCGNNMNTGSIHGLALEEADGLRQLWGDGGAGDNRGDGGDPYPGTSANTEFSFNTVPAAVKNADGTFIGFAVDSVKQVVANGAMSFRLRFGGPTTVQASDVRATVQVDGTPYTVFNDLLDDGSSHTIAVVDSQLVASGQTRLTFVSWSDAGAISHSIIGSLAGATYTATLQAEHRLQVTVHPHGTVGYSPAADSSGTFLVQGTSVTLTATPDPNYLFGGWSGDTATANPSVLVHMAHPYTVVALFDTALVLTSTGPRPAGVMGKPYADTLRASGGSGSFTWSLISGSLPPGVSFVSDGRIVGIPSAVGSFGFTMRVTSGPQHQDFADTVSVTAPTLVKSAVVAQMLSGSSSLTPDDLTYLDLIGNNNSTFDVGDFLAWVLATGATPTPPDATAVTARRPTPRARQIGGRP
jgi:M6 family metalloprotease-like protein